MKTRISKAYRGQKHIGWKKTVGGREWFLGTGTSPGEEARAIRLAQALEASWQLAKIAGAWQLSEADFNATRDLIEGRRAVSAALRLQATPAVVINTERPTPPQIIAPAPPAPATGHRRWLFESLEEFVGHVLGTLKQDMSNGDHVINTRDRIDRAKDAVQDAPLDSFSRKELDSWLASIRHLKHKANGEPLAATTVRNHVGAVRMAFTKFAEWQWWTPPLLWERAFKDYTIKKLQTTAERKKAKRRPPAHTISEKRILWHMAFDFTKAIMTMADWAGHTQKEVATLTLEEIKDEADGMFIERDRNKTGVHGRWWIPPEAAGVIRKVIARTPRNPAANPDGLAFLTAQGQPLVYRSKTDRHARIDNVRPEWEALLRATKPYGVRHISYKFMRKAMAQQIRDLVGKEVSRTFLAHADEDVQDTSYTRASRCKSRSRRSPALSGMAANVRTAEAKRMARIERSDHAGKRLGG